jgi:hypothetical protein
MNSKTAIEYIKFAYWALKSKQSIEECLKLNDSVEIITDHIKNIVNDATLDKELDAILPNINKPKKQTKKAAINEHIEKNMEIYGTTEQEAREYESRCHNCGADIPIGQKCCDKGCSKFIEEFNYDCYWGKSCKMCHTHDEYIVITRNFEFGENNYWIDIENNVYTNDGTKVAVARDDIIVYA